MPFQTLASWHWSTCAVGVSVLFLVRYKECHPICMRHTKGRKVGIAPGSDCFGSLGPLGPGHLCFTEVNGACPTITLPGFLSHAILPFQDLSAPVLARQVAKGM